MKMMISNLRWVRAERMFNFEGSSRTSGPSSSGPGPSVEIRGIK